MAGIKEKYIKIAILCLILLDVFLVLYSCSNRHKLETTNNLTPITASVSAIQEYSGNEMVTSYLN